MHTHTSFIRFLITLGFIPCHRRKDRSLFFFGKQFPLCARCMAMNIGYLFVIPLMLTHIHIAFWYGIFLNAPMFMDGFTQKWGWRTSTNALRVVTGLLSGLGMSIIIVDTSKWIVQLFS
jgi:uncharacterized membrane protein